MEPIRSEAPKKVDYLKLLESLVKDKQAQVSDGVTLKCGSEINLSIFSRDDSVVIKFGPPSVKVEVSKMGAFNLLNTLRPTLQEIVITSKSYKIVVDNAPDMEIKR